MSDITRRDALVRLAVAFTAAAAIDNVDAREAHTAIHQDGAGERGAYALRALSVDQFRTLERLTDLIIPAENGKPGAVKADVPAWIDSLLDVNAELKTRYITGLAWLDSTMRTRHGRMFVEATPEQQTSVMDQIAFQKNRSPELDPGIDFFILARRMTVDGFYTSPIGMRDLYPGNTPRSEFTVPQEAYDYVLSRSPFRL